MGRKKKIAKNTQSSKQQEEDQKIQLIDLRTKQLSSKKELAQSQDEAEPKAESSTINHHKKKNNHTSHHVKRGQSFREHYPHYTWQEVAKHDNKDDVWVVIEDNVYDVTKLVDRHPGGPKVIMHRAGKEATKQFRKGHHPYHVLEDKLPKLMIGRIKSDSSIESWQRQKKTGKMDLFCVSVLSLILFTSLLYLITT